MLAPCPHRLERKSLPRSSSFSSDAACSSCLVAVSQLRFFWESGTPSKLRRRLRPQCLLLSRATARGRLSVKSRISELRWGVSRLKREGQARTRWPHPSPGLSRAGATTRLSSDGTGNGSLCPGESNCLTADPWQWSRKARAYLSTFL